MALVPINTAQNPAWVDTGGSGGAGATNLNVVSTVGPTFAASYNDFIEADSTANAITINLPAANAVSPSNGNVLVVKSTGTNQSHLVSVAPQGSDSVDGRSYLNTVLAPGETLYLVSDGVSKFNILVFPAASGIYNIRQFGAIGDGLTHPLSAFFPSLAAAQVVYPFANSLTNEIDWCAAQLAINLAATGVNTGSQAATGGTVQFPKGVYLMDQPLDLAATFGVTLSGAGHGWVGTGNNIDGSSVIVYTTGDSSRVLDCRSSFACTIDRLSIVYSHPDYTGDVIDISHINPEDSESFLLRDCMFSGGLATATGGGAHSLLYLGNAISSGAENCIFGKATRAIYGRKQDGSYSNEMTFENCIFVFQKYATVNAGDRYGFSDCTFEGTAGELLAAYYEEYLDVVIQPANTITFDAVAKTITRSDGGSFIADGWVVGQNVSSYEAVGGLNVLTFNTPLSAVTASTLTLAGCTNMTSEVRNSDCKLYGVSTTQGVASPTTQATLGQTLTFAADGTITRSVGSWIDDGAFIGQEINVSGTTSNDGVFNPVTAVSATVLSLAADLLTFSAATKQISRTSGSWITDGFALGMPVTVAGTINNNGDRGTVTAVTATVLTVSAALVDEANSTTADVYSLFQEEFQARTVASAGHSFTPQVATTGRLFQLAGATVLAFDRCWFGDQFVPTTWLQFGGASAVSLYNCDFVGGLRVADFRQTITGLTIGGRSHLVTIQEPLSFQFVCEAIDVRANLAQSAADVYVNSAANPPISIDLFNTTPDTGNADIFNRFATEWTFTTTGQAVFKKQAIGAAIDSLLALTVQQGGDTSMSFGSMSLNSVATPLFQSFGVVLYNYWGGHILMNFAGISNVGIGALPTETPNSVLQVAGAIATDYHDVTAGLTLDSTFSFVDIDASVRNVTATLPDATTCKGRRYSLKRVDNTANTATVATTNSQTIDGALTYALAAQNSAVVVVSSGANWRIESKI